MSGKKRVLFVVNGFGLGNATRCEGVMDFIKPDFEIDVITSDKASTFFADNKKITNLYRQADISRQVRPPFGSLLYYLSQAHFFLVRIFKNYQIQKNIIKKNNYELIFFDSDYGFVLHRIFGHHTLIGINNAYEVVQFFKNNLRELRPKFLFSFILELLDYLVCHTFLHHVFCPSISWKSLIKKSDAQRFVCPLFVRESLFQSYASADHPVLFIVSSSGVKSELYRVREEYRRLRPEASAALDFEKNNVQSLQDASVVFCNAGQSSIAECLYLNKKTVLFPIPRHAEQLANAKLAATESTMTIYSGEKLPEILQEAASAPSLITERDYVQAKEIFLSYFQKLILSQEQKKS